MKLDERLLRKYKILTLKKLLDRSLGYEGDGVEVVFARLDSIWSYMNNLEKECVEDWVRKLPDDLRANGPKVVDADGWERASGSVECSTCGLLYRDHPIDTRINDFELYVTCDGSRWKL